MDGRSASRGRSPPGACPHCRANLCAYATVLSGNLFVIRYDQNWQPAVTQLDATLNKAGTEEEVNAFKSVLKDDKIVQQLCNNLAVRIFS
jgi:hypothetical protein